MQSWAYELNGLRSPVLGNTMIRAGSRKASRDDLRGSFLLVLGESGGAGDVCSKRVAASLLPFFVSCSLPRFNRVEELPHPPHGPDLKLAGVVHELIVRASPIST